MGIEEKANPYDIFQAWLAEAEKSEPNDPNAVALATADAAGMPAVRMVLLKGQDERGFVFYTNFESDKGKDLEANPQAALCFHWKSLRRQVRVQGAVEKVSAEEADAYFQSRARESRIGAWASKQSRSLEGRFALEKAVAKYTAKFGIGEVPRPEHWGGFLIRPKRIEFWKDGAFRLHDRLIYIPDGQGGWTTDWLYP